MPYSDSGRAAFNRYEAIRAAQVPPPTSPRRHLRGSDGPGRGCFKPEPGSPALGTHISLLVVQQLILACHVDWEIKKTCVGINKTCKRFLSIFPMASTYITRKDMLSLLTETQGGVMWCCGAVRYEETMAQAPGANELQLLPQEWFTRPFTRHQQT
jgi:hypothetical protein